MYEPKHLKRWTYDGPTAFDSRSNYMGADMRDWYVAPCSRTRDAGTLEVSNFECCKAELEPLAVDTPDGEGATVQAHSFNHWACGWYELILIHESDERALRAADDIADRLSTYPVLDETDWSEREFEAASEYWSICGMRERIFECARDRVSIFAARRDELPQDIDISRLADGC